MIALTLTDHQRDNVMIAAGRLPPEKRALMFERVAARLRLRCGTSHHASDADVAEAVDSAMHGLLHKPAA